MVKFINKWTGSIMWVAEDRVDEYKAAGHKLAADSEKPTVKDEPKAEAEEIKEPEVKQTKKAAKTTKASTKKK